MADEASRSKKRKMKLEVSKARCKSKREEPLSESSEPSDSSYSYSHRYRKKTKSKEKNGRGRARNRSVSVDHSDQKRSLGKGKRQERQEKRADLEKKKRRRKKRSPSPVKQNKRRRYRSLSTCSHSSRSTTSSYLSDSCSTCSTNYNSSGGGRVKKISDRSKKSNRRRVLTKRNGHTEPENKKTTHSYKNVRGVRDTKSQPENKKATDSYKNVRGDRDTESQPENKKTTKSYKNVRGDRDTESPNWKAYGHHDMLRKRKRDYSVERDNLLVDGQGDSCDDGKQSSEPLSSVVKFGIEGQKGKKCVNDASDAVALELLLRKKALENLIKFRRFGSGTTEISLSNDSERPFLVDSRVVDGTGSGLRGTKEFRRDEQDLTGNLPDEHPRDGRTSKDASNLLVRDTFGTNGSCSIKHKLIEIGDKESHIESINMNKERTCKSEMAKVEEPVIETSQECGLRTDIVSNKLTCAVLEAHTSKIEKSQTHMLQVDKKLQTEMPPLDVISMPSKNKTSKTELTKDDKATTESLDIAASQIGLPNLDDSNPPKLEGSSFQQKTMSVRQGGETVQVSYRVYIPQQSAALARRHLKR